MEPAASTTTCGDDASVSVVIPVLNEEESLPILLDFLHTKCTPRPNEVVISDGGSTDATLAIAQKFQQQQQEKNNGMSVVLVPPLSAKESTDVKPCRALSLNRGLEAATSDLVIFIHADTLPPSDFVIHMREIMSSTSDDDKSQRGQRVSLSAFSAIIIDDKTQKVNPFITFHHFIKTYYGPLLLYPYQAIFKGLLCFFGDQCMFGRRSELLQVGGFDLVPVLEEQSLNKKMLAFGRQKMVTSASCTTSDRRIALYGTFKVTLLHCFLCFGFELFGVSLEWLAQFYPPQKVVEEQFRLRNLSKVMRFNHFCERQFLWKEIVQDRSYDHPQLSFSPRTKTKQNGENGSSSSSSSSSSKDDDITIVDVGANVGLFSLWMANSTKLQAAASAVGCRRSTIHALEPSPHTYQLLESNVARVQAAASEESNKSSNDIRVVPHQLAVSGQQAEQELTFTTYPRCSGWSTFHRDEASLYHDLHAYLAERILALFGSALGRLVNATLLALIYPLAFCILTSGASTSKVPVMNLSSFIQEHGIQRIDLLKIDVERHEYQVLLGIADADWPKIQAIAMEAEVHQSDILQLLRERGRFDIVEETKDPFMAKTPHSMIWALRKSS